MNELPTVLGVEPFVPFVILCYILGAVLKGLGKEKLDKFIPEILAVFGGCIAVLIYNTIPNYLPAYAQNWFAAFILGTVSGLVAVGVNQIYKQLKTPSEDYIDGVAEDEEPVKGEPDKEA